MSENSIKRGRGRPPDSNRKIADDPARLALTFMHACQKHAALRDAFYRICGNGKIGNGSAAYRAALIWEYIDNIKPSDEFFAAVLPDNPDFVVVTTRRDAAKTNKTDSRKLPVSTDNDRIKYLTDKYARFFKRPNDLILLDEGADVLALILLPSIRHIPPEGALLVRKMGNVYLLRLKEMGFDEEKLVKLVKNVRRWFEGAVSSLNSIERQPNQKIGKNA